MHRMIKSHLKIISSLLLIASFGAVSALADTVINFDDLDASAGDVVLGSYGGFSWSNFAAYTATPGFPGFNAGIVSAPNAAYSGGQAFTASVMPVTGTISSATPFDFISSYLGSGYYDNLNITVEGLLAGTVVYSQTVTVSTPAAQLFDFGYDGIDEVALFATATAATSDPYGCGSFNCTQFTLDDLTIAPSSGPPPSISPEPSSSVLLSLGSASVFLLLRRRTIWARLARSLSRH